MFYSEAPYADLIFQDATQKIITLKGSKYSWYVRNGLTDFLVMIRELLRFLLKCYTRFLRKFFFLFLHICTNILCLDSITYTKIIIAIVILPEREGTMGCLLH